MLNLKDKETTMKNLKYIGIVLLFISNVIIAQVPGVAPVQKKTIVLKGGIIHDGNANVLENKVIIIKNGLISEIQDASSANIDQDATVYDLSGKHIYPGFILPMSDLGLSEIGAVRASVDSRETGVLNPNVRSIVAYNTDSEIGPTLRSNGILLAQVIPQGGLISGSSSVVHLDAWNWEDAIVAEDNIIHVNWPSKVSFSRFSGEMRENKNYPNQIQVLTSFFDDAMAYFKEEIHKHTNLKLEALSTLFDGRTKVFISTSSPAEIIESVSFMQKYGIKDIVLTGVDENAWKVKDFIKDNNVSLILSDLHRMPAQSDYDVWLPFKMPAKFVKEGIKVCLSNGWTAKAMNLPFLAGTAVAYGLDKEIALQLLTKNSAEILGVGDKLGVIEVGKNATLFVSDGDALDIASNNVIFAFIDGREIDLDSRHKYLYRKFQKKYEQ